MWNERKMPERWYELLRERMQLEEQRMRAMKDGDILEHEDLAELMAQADGLDREMLLVMRQAIAGTLAHEAARPKIAPYQHSRLRWQPGTIG